MRVQTIFIGNEAPFLDEIRSHSNLSHIVCTKIRGKARKYFGSAFDYAKKHKIVTIEPTEFLSCPSPTDIIVVAGYPRLIPPHIIKHPRIGIINIHMSLLPEYRGRHPLNWAIINGEKYAGITIHHINEHFDDGNIICQDRIPIKSKDTIMDIHERAVSKGKLLLRKMFDMIGRKKFLGVSQNSRYATYFPPRTPKGGKIDWNEAAVKIKDLVRALVEPYPGAYFYHRGKKVIVDEVEVVRIPMVDAGIGKPFLLEGRYIVKTGKGFLKLSKIRNCTKYKILDNIPITE